MRIPVLLTGLALLAAGCDWSSTDEPGNPLNQTTWTTNFVVRNSLFEADEAWSTTVELQEFDEDLYGVAEWEFQWVDPDPWLDEEPVYGFTEYVEGERYSGDSLRFALYTAPASEEYDCDLRDHGLACASVRPAALYFFGAVTSDSTMAGYGVAFNGTSYTRVDGLVFDRED